MLDASNIATLTPSNWPSPPSQASYVVYYTETGNAGSAYLGEGVEGEQGSFVPLRDPRIFGAPRSVRVGIGVRF